MHEERDEKNSFGYFNNPVAQSSFVQIRLDTKPLLTDVETFLSGRKAIIKLNEKGEFYEDYESRSPPLANEEGICNILNILRLSMMNEHVVQGNFKEEKYYYLMVDTRKELTDQIITNCYNWEVEDSKINLIIDTIMRFFKLFISRVIDNKERESYTQQFVSRETFTQGNKRNPVQQFTDGLK